MSIVPNRFLVRLAHPVPYLKNMPLAKGSRLLDLPDDAAFRNFAELDGAANFSDVRLGWNEFGIGLQLTVSGKTQPVECDVEKPRSSDGATVWIDTRGDRTSHRASRTCHQFYLLPSGGGADKDEACFSQSKLNRALQDAPICSTTDVRFRADLTKTGYRIEAFFPASVLSGYDPQEHPRLGFYYAIRDRELGDQYSSVNTDFPFADDPSLWATLDLVK